MHSPQEYDARMNEEIKDSEFPRSPFVRDVLDACKFLAQPIVWGFERLGLLRPTLIARYDIETTWDDDDVDVDETITFFLLEFPKSGRRTYKVHEYGNCARLDYHEIYLPEVLVWTMGGPLPPSSTKVGSTAQVLKLVKE